jgi:hypothetical protein
MIGGDVYPTTQQAHQLVSISRHLESGRHARVPDSVNNSTRTTTPSRWEPTVILGIQRLA